MVQSGAMSGIRSEGLTLHRCGRMGPTGTFLLAPSQGLRKLNNILEECDPAWEILGVGVHLSLSRKVYRLKNTSLRIQDLIHAAQATSLAASAGSSWC